MVYSEVRYNYICKNHSRHFRICEIGNSCGEFNGENVTTYRYCVLLYAGV